MLVQALQDCMLVLVHADIPLKVPATLLTVVTRVLELGLGLVGLVIHVVWAEVVVFESSVGHTSIASALSGSDIGPTLMQAREGRELFPNGNVVCREKGVLTMRSATDHFINPARPGRRGHRVRSSGLVVPNNIGQWDLGEFPETPTEPFVDRLKG